MVDLAVSLPEPRPDDDEDVVWGLSTASALWARGEHGDAVVWLRRAVDAAASAGQEKRAADLLVAIRRVEQTLEDSVRHTMPPPPLAEPAAAETLPDVRVPAAPVPDRKSLGIELELEPAAVPPPQVAPTSTKPASSAPRPPATPAITRLLRLRRAARCPRITSSRARASRRARRSSIRGPRRRRCRACASIPRCVASTSKGTRWWCRCAGRCRPAVSSRTMKTW